jgi:hypothetical protein
MAAGFTAMPLVPPRPGHVAAFLGLYTVVFLLYLVAVRAALRPAPPGGACSESGRAVARAVIVVAVLFRLPLLFAAPALSNDLLRFLWDGRVLLATGNPYGVPPEAPALVPLRDSTWEAMDHRDVPTIYPPAAQALFATATAVGGVGSGAAGLALKLLVLLADLGVMVTLRWILERRGLSPVRLLVYAWNPLVVVEAAWSGHIEPAAVLCVLLGAAALIRERDLAATLALTLGGLVKLMPLALLAPLLRRVRARWLVLPPILIAAAYWPFRAAGAGLLGGLDEYARRWLANESLFAVVRGVITWVAPTEALKVAIAWVRAHVPHTGFLDALYFHVHPLDLAKAVCAAAAAGVAVVIVRRRIEPLRGMYLMTGALLLLSPTAHPWYLLWIAPWLCLFPSRAWVMLTGLAALAYLNLGAAARDAEPHPWVRLVEYLPFYALLIADAFRSRVRRRTGAQPDHDPAPVVEPPAG